MFDNDLFGTPVENAHGSILAKTFEYPPFSVLSARDGWWQERKRQWLALGIKSEVGRGGANTSGSSREMELAGGFRPEHGVVGGGGLTWGNSPQITQKGLNYYREKHRREAAPAQLVTTEKPAQGAMVEDGQYD